MIVALVINSTSAAILYLRGKPVSGWEPLENISLLAFPPFCYVSTLLENTGNNVDQYAHLFKASNFSKRTHNMEFSKRVTQVWCQQSILTCSSLKETSFRIISSQHVCSTFLINAINAVNQAFWEAINTLLAFLWFFNIILQTKVTLFSLFPSLALSFLPFSLWVSTSSTPG